MSIDPSILLYQVVTSVLGTLISGPINLFMLLPSLLVEFVLCHAPLSGLLGFLFWYSVLVNSIIIIIIISLKIAPFNIKMIKSALHELNVYMYI